MSMKKQRKSGGVNGLASGWRGHASKESTSHGLQRLAALLLFLLFALAWVGATAAEQGPVDAEAVKVGEKVILERGLHHRVVQTANGATYTELETGMHYERAGQLLESKETIVIDQEGYGVADQAMHTARFSPSILDGVLYTDPEGNPFKVRPMGLVFYDYRSGRSVLFCE